MRSGAEKLRCAKCRAPLEPRSGPGRPPTYCSEVCRRLIEGELRRLDRRLDRYELERRELKAQGPGLSLLDADERAHRLRVLRAWIRQDEVRMRVLLTGGRGA